MPFARYTVPAALAVVLAASGCGLLPGGDDGGGTPKPSSAASAKPGDLTGGRHYRTGWYDVENNRIAWDVHRVERYPAYSVLYVDLYTFPGSGTYTFGSGGTDNADFSGFSLLDPVGGRYYSALREDDDNGKVFGSRAGSDTNDPFITEGVRHPLMLYFPALPAGTRQIDVLTPGTTGEMTGIPVLDGGKPRPVVPGQTRTDPKPGQAFFYPVTPPRGKIWSQSVDLHDYVEGPSRSTTSGGDEQKIGLRTDVLFAFDKANLSAKATAVLDAAVEETRKNADPSRPPVTITGFTDSKGSDAYNQKLSERRAAAVQKYVSAKLGSAYRYRATGKGEADPIAANTKKGGGDNPAGRARNRRVEISYKIKHRTPKVTTTSSAAPAPGTASAAAAFHNGDGPVIGTVTAHSGNLTGEGVRLSVHPFYRDGAYMVGVYTLRSFGGGLSDVGAASSAWWMSDGTIKAMRGADFGGITAVDPATKDRYYEVRAGDFVDGTAGFAEGAYQISLPEEKDTRIYVYYPAPPASTAKVDVDVAGDGTVRNVPVR